MIECPAIQERDWTQLTPEEWEQLTAGWANVYAQDPATCIAAPDNLIDTWAAMLKIKTKAQGIQRLLANTTQMYILSAIYGMRDAGLPVRIIILKGRQQGSTTGVMGYQFMETVSVPDSGAMVIADQADHASNIFEMYRLAYEMIPAHARPLKRYDAQGKRLVFENPSEKHRAKNPGLRSRIEVTQESTVASYTFQRIHLSEAAFFDDLNATLAMLLQTVPSDPATTVVIESTANRYGDDFHTLWQAASEGKSDWFPLFIPWYVHDEYQVAPYQDEEGQNQWASGFARTLHTREDMEFGNERELYERLKDDGLTLEKLAWRRWCIRNNCQGSLGEFDRQYPSTPEVAFLAQEKGLFSSASLMWYLENVTMPRVGDMREHPRTRRAEFVENLRGVVRIYEPVDTAAEYVIGSDHAEGLDSGDHNAAVVWRRLPLKVVATVRGYDGRRITIAEIADILRLLGLHYNKAWICPENNADGGRCADRLQDARYPRLITEKMLDISTMDRIGWRNTTLTRKRVLELLQETVDKQLAEIPDETLIRECLSMVVINGKPRAAKKSEDRRPGTPEDGYYDDLVFAAAGGLLAHECLPAVRVVKRQWRRDVERREQMADVGYDAAQDRVGWNSYV